MDNYPELLIERGGRSVNERKFSGSSPDLLNRYLKGSKGNRSINKGMIP